MPQSRLSEALLAPGLSTMSRLGAGGKAALLALLGIAALGWSGWRESAGGLTGGVFIAHLVGAFVLVYLSLAVWWDSARSVGGLKDSARTMAQGDLGSMVTVEGRGDLADIGQTLETVKNSFASMVAGIRSDSVVVAHSGKSLAAAAAELATRTERQAATLEQTAASVQELSDTTQQNARDAVAVEALSARVRGVADSGGQQMKHAVDAVRAIKDSSARMHDVISVIEGIAFQTNILALNASVEAARAGDQGRGFAVVASEVRALALRSSEAAKEVRALIATSSGHVDSGVKRIDQVNGMLGDIVMGVSQLATNLHSITSATTQQSAALVEITQAIHGLDEITQQNAQMVERTSAESAELGQRAERLADSVGGFRLRQGTADEALALVQAAEARYRQKGNAALSEITNATSGFSDRDMYVFAWDRGLVYHAFAGKPGNVGKSAAQILGTDVSRLTKDVWTAAASGGGWVDYDFLNPVNGQVLPKTSYVIGVSENLVLGCGIYKTARVKRTR